MRLSVSRWDDLFLGEMVCFYVRWFVSRWDDLFLGEMICFWVRWSVSRWGCESFRNSFSKDSLFTVETVYLEKTFYCWVRVFFRKSVSRLGSLLLIKTAGCLVVLSSRGLAVAGPVGVQGSARSCSIAVYLSLYIWSSCGFSRLNLRLLLLYFLFILDLAKYNAGTEVKKKKN